MICKLSVPSEQDEGIEGDDEVGFPPFVRRGEFSGAGVTVTVVIQSIFRFILLAVNFNFSWVSTSFRLQYFFLEITRIQSHLQHLGNTRISLLHRDTYIEY